MIRYISISVILIALHFNISAQTLPLDSCKTMALENNKRLKEAQMKLEAAKLVKKNASTNYFPKVDAGVTLFKSNKDLLQMDVPEMQLPVFDGNIANLPGATEFAFIPGMQIGMLDYANCGFVSAVQPVYAGGQIRNGNKLAKLGVEINQQNLTLSEDEVKVKTEEYFWLLISLKEKMKTLLSYEELVNALLNDVEVSYDAGLIQKSDLLKVQLKKNELETNKLQLQNGIDMVSISLCQHIGIKYSKDINFEDELLENKSPLQYMVNPKESILHRKEFQILNKVKKAEELKHKMVRGEYMPQFAVGVSGLYLDVLENDNTNLLAFATVSIPISDWWGGSHRLKKHKIHINMAQNRIDETSELIELEMEKKFKDLNEAWHRISVSRRSVDQAAEHHKVIMDNYSAGLVNTSDMLEAQALLQASKDAETDALCTYKVRLTYYLKSIGK